MVGANDRVLILYQDATYSMLHVRPGDKFRLAKNQVAVDPIIGTSQHSASRCHCWADIDVRLPLWISVSS